MEKMTLVEDSSECTSAKNGRIRPSHSAAERIRRSCMKDDFCRLNQVIITNNNSKEGQKLQISFDSSKKMPSRSKILKQATEFIELLSQELASLRRTTDECKRSYNIQNSNRPDDFKTNATEIVGVATIAHQPQPQREHNEVPKDPMAMAIDWLINDNENQNSDPARFSSQEWMLPRSAQYGNTNANYATPVQNYIWVAATESILNLDELCTPETPPDCPDLLNPSNSTPTATYQEPFGSNPKEFNNWMINYK